MPFKLDHVIVHVENLDAGIEAYRQRGYNAFYGGVHASGTTHNALICFADGSYIELLALTGNPPREAGGIDFSTFVQGKPEGVVGWAVGSSDLDADVQRLRAQGAAVNEPTPGQRQRADGVMLQWRMVWLAAKLPLLILQDVTPRNLRVPDDAATTTQPNGVTGIEALAIPASMDEPKLFPLLFGSAEEPVGGDKIYTLENARLIASPLTQQPEIRSVKTG